MKISKAELLKMKACVDGLDRFIKQTNNTADAYATVYTADADAYATVYTADADAYAIGADKVNELLIKLFED